MNNYNTISRTFGMGLFSVVGMLVKVATAGAAVWFIVRTVATIIAAGAV